MDTAWRPRGADVVLAAGLVFAISEPGFDPYHHDGGTFWAAIGLAATATVAWRRAAPRGVWLTVTALTTTLLVMRRGPDWGGLSPLVLMPAALVALYTVTSRTNRATGQRAMAVTMLALEGGLLSHATRPEAVAMTAALVVSAWAVSEGARARAGENAERELRAAAEERGRIARELHDVLAHHVSVISLQAGTARLLAESGAAPDAALLAGIENASRQAMTELRHALGVITHTPGGTEPLPGLARLGELTAGSGLAVSVEGDTGPLPAAVDLTAYRVIQESLTNVLRHSAAPAAHVRLRNEAGTLHITVCDSGPGRTAPALRGTGRGLAGLRERVAAHGGTFLAGPRPGAGFEVRAELPVPGTLA